MLACRPGRSGWARCFGYDVRQQARSITSSTRLACSLKVLAAAASAACTVAGDGCHPYLACTRALAPGDVMNNFVSSAAREHTATASGVSHVQCGHGSSAAPQVCAPGWSNQAPRLGLQPDRRCPPLLGTGCRPSPCGSQQCVGLPWLIRGKVPSISISPTPHSPVAAV